MGSGVCTVRTLPLNQSLRVFGMFRDVPKSVGGATPNSAPYKAFDARGWRQVTPGLVFRWRIARRGGNSGTLLRRYHKSARRLRELDPLRSFGAPEEDREISPSGIVGCTRTASQRTVKPANDAGFSEYCETPSNAQALMLLRSQSDICCMRIT